MNVITEAIILGFMLLLISIPIMYITREYCKDYFKENPYIKYYIATIIIGMSAHFALEYSGLNYLYCKSRYKCIT